MKTISKVFALMLVLALAIVPVISVAETTSADVGFEGNPTVTANFGDMNSGKVKVTVYNTSTDAVTVTIKAVDYYNESHVYCTVSDLQVPAKVDDTKGTATTELSWTIDSSGTKYVKFNLTASDGSTASNTINFDVSHSIWKDPWVYVVIIVIIILIAIAVFLKLRSNEKIKKKDPNAKTFTEMREEKLAGKNKGETKQISAEKKTYEAKSERKSKRKE